jgi:hypothetical protein
MRNLRNKTYFFFKKCFILILNSLSTAESGKRAMQFSFIYALKAGKSHCLKTCKTAPLKAGA